MQSGEQRATIAAMCAEVRKVKLTRKRFSAACSKNARETRWRHSASATSAPSAQRIRCISKRLWSRVAMARMTSKEASAWMEGEGEVDAAVDAKTEADGGELDGEQEARIAVAQRRTRAVCSAVNRGGPGSQRAVRSAINGGGSGTRRTVCSIAKGSGPRHRSACCSSGVANRRNSGPLMERRLHSLTGNNEDDWRKGLKEAER